MQPLLNQFSDVRDTVKLRLTAKDADALPLDGTAGPRPFDIEPLEKWLYEAYARYYKNDETFNSAFWAGLAGAMEASVPIINETHRNCIKRSADLIDQIANNFGVEAILKKAFERVNELIGMQRETLQDVDDINALMLQGAVLRFSLLTSPDGTSNSVLQSEKVLWESIHRCMVNDCNAVSVMLVADTLCTLFRAWAIMGRRELVLQPIVRVWCQTGAVDKGRLESYMKRNLSLLKLSRARYNEAIWQTLESCVSGRPHSANAVPSAIPRYRRQAAPVMVAA